MSNTITRLALLLAGTGLSRGELRRTLWDLQRFDPDEILKQVELLRELTRHGFVGSRLYNLPLDYDLLSLKDLVSPRESRESKHLTRTNEDVGIRVERLLKEEARLSTAEAVAELGSSLVADNQIDINELPPLSKKALSNWVSRLSMRVPEKLILKHATLVRNKFVHDPPPAWQLRGSRN
ncbi:hypothetical protein [Achromobacter insolitus]|uniref:hypothetical protein n=1 Tax=Achromobacter insolitus TaxID=217204 RepID=UPI00366F51EA